MTHFLEDSVYHFFDQRIDPKQPILLGLSGGPDSICLMYLLLDWGRKRSLRIHLVHIDHGWRKESAFEAEKLGEIAATVGLPIHTIRLQPDKYEGNIEAESRKERFDYFCRLQREVGAQGILLGHHADDHAETVLKRVLEGASLPYLSAMSPVAEVGSLIVMRPLLTVKKKQVLEWLTDRGIDYFEDVTNSDPRFLRARMRAVIFPFLRQSFGKEFDQNLCEIAAEALELRHYLDDLVDPILQKRVESDWGVMIEMEKSLLKAPFEWAYLLRKICRQLDIVISRYQVTLAVNALLSKKANVQILTGLQSLICDRGKAFFIISPMKQVVELQPLAFGEQRYGDWKIEVSLLKSSDRELLENSWKDVWKGCCSTVLPQGEYFLGKAEPQERRFFLATGQSKTLNRFLNEKKVPHFLVSKAPMVLSSRGVVEDFFSDSKVSKYEGPCLHIAMKRGFKD